MGHWLSNSAITLVVLELLIGGNGVANAMDSCNGRYSAALITPLTQPTVVALEHVQPDWNRRHARMGVPKHPRSMIRRSPVSVTGGADALAAWQILFAGSSRARL